MTDQPSTEIGKPRESSIRKGFMSRAWGKYLEITGNKPLSPDQVTRLGLLEYIVERIDSPIRVPIPTKQGIFSDDILYREYGNVVAGRVDSDLARKIDLEARLLAQDGLWERRQFDNPSRVPQIAWFVSNPEKLKEALILERQKFQLLPSPQK